jgi:hypothetical protein
MGRQAFRTTHPYGHFLRGAVGVAATIAGFYATIRLPLTDSTAISFTAPLFMILTRSLCSAKRYGGGAGSPRSPALSACSSSVPEPARPAGEYAALVLHLCQNVMINGEVVRLDGALRTAPR